MIEVTNRKEYFQLAGQVAYYLATKSAAKKKNFDSVIDIDKTRTVEKLQQKLIELKKKREHKLSLANKDFKKAFELLLSFELDGKITTKDRMQYVLGTVKENIFYKKDEQKEEKERKTVTKVV